jgi:hypothetical protein
MGFAVMNVASLDRYRRHMSAKRNPQPMQSFPARLTSDPKKTETGWRLEFEYVLKAAIGFTEVDDDDANGFEIGYLGEGDLIMVDDR